MTQTKGDTDVNRKTQAPSTAATPWPAVIVGAATHAFALRALAIRARSATCLVVAVSALFAFAPIMPAFASPARVPAHPFKETFGSVTQPSFTRPANMAVDQATGDVYVIQLGAAGEGGTLSRYKENGEPDNFSALSGNAINGHAGEADEVPGIEETLSTESGIIWEAQVAVAPASAGATAGDIYVTDAFHHVIDVFAASGAYLGQKSVGYPCGVAVDSSGTVFVGSREGEEAVYKLKATAPGALSEVAHFATAKPCLVAAGSGPSAGSVFVAQVSGETTKLNAETGSLESTPFSGETSSLSVDPVTGHLYLSSFGELKELDASGATATEVSSTTIPTSLRGVATNATTGNVYVARAKSSKLEVYGPIVERTVTVTVTGNGEVSSTAGSVEPVAGSIANCTSARGPACTATYLAGDEPEFEAVAEPGNSLVGWTSVQHAASTTCTGAVTPCAIKLKTEPAENVTAAVEFALSGNELTIEKEGSGAGVVASLQSGLSLEAISCGAHCGELYSPSTIVQLTAGAETGSEFVGWSTVEGDPGTCTGTTSPCEVTMSEAVKLRAAFTLQRPSTLIVFKGGAGTGTVTSLAPHTGIGCGSSCEETSLAFEEGQTIELEATAAPGSVFAGWIGCRHVSASTCQVKLGSAEVEATAVFLLEGKDGATGPEGPTGKEGLIGATGKEGPIGPTGKEGKQGPAGAQGQQGATGAQGATGGQGERGAAGVAGPAGAAGPAGPQGEKGETGPAGKVTCTVKQHGKKVRVTCTVRYAAAKANASASRRALRWVLVHVGRVVAHGRSRRVPRVDLGVLRRGRYTLYLDGQSKGTVIDVH